ncbi:MAG: PIN domain-containing protein [Ferruginibacter sp.]|nr:PIN domain-containing protein [Ferruginibacter sp.]
MQLSPQKIFIDANVLIDLLNKSNDLHNAALVLFNDSINNKKVIYCSPTSFAIVYYFLGKTIKNKVKLNKTVKELFLLFSFTREDNIVMDKVLTSDFSDLEDSLQYYSALDAKADVIITKNYFDFKASAIPVYHPLHYVNEFII